MNAVIWSPTPEMTECSALAKFAKKMGYKTSEYDSLHRWSIGDLGRFWSEVWDFTEIIGEKGTNFFQSDPDSWMTNASFFADAKVNLAENFLRKTGRDTVVIEADESGYFREYCADELRSDVARIAKGLREAGVTQGDRVGVVMSNRVPCLITHLACLSIGAVWTSCSPDFGLKAIIDRFGQVNPKVLFVDAEIKYAGKPLDLVKKGRKLFDRIESAETLVFGPTEKADLRSSEIRWSDFGDAEELTFVRLDFNSPAYILYTSGTTGIPKAIVHRTGGVLLQQLKEHVLHNDVKEGDRVLWYTNTAWMMYHWIVSALGCGAVLVLYDGAPVLKDKGGVDCSPLWRVVEQQQLTHLGVSPKYLATLADNHYVPREHFDTSSLRWLLSAGSPVAPHQYDWIYDSISSSLGFSSISGGTEIMGCFLLGSPAHCVRKGTLTTKALGMAVNVFDKRGVSVFERRGDLVCSEPFPSMPLCFWGENGRDRYFKNYFSQYKEVWFHGDFAQLNADGTGVIFGRSDNTLNPGGVRIGTADIYGVCERYTEIQDCVVFGRPIVDDEEIVLCIMPAEGSDIDSTFVQQLRFNIRKSCSPRHVPASVYLVDEIPYTLNGKRVENAAKSSMLGEKINNLSSLSNPNCLAQYRELTKEQSL